MVRSRANVAGGTELLNSDNPRAASRVVIINRASRKFVSDLLGEVDGGARPTSRFEARTTRRPHPVVGHTRTTGPSRMRLPVIRGSGFSVQPGPTR